MDLRSERLVEAVRKTVFAQTLSVAQAFVHLLLIAVSTRFGWLQRDQLRLAVATSRATA